MPLQPHPHPRSAQPGRPGSGRTLTSLSATERQTAPNHQSSSTRSFLGGTLRPCLIIPAGSVKNSKPFVGALPNWLVTSLLAYAPDLNNPAIPDFPVWRSRDTASLSRASVERSIRKTSLCLVNEPLQPHEYRRLHCVFVQDSDDIDQTKAHLITGHTDPETLYTCYPSAKVPDYLDELLAPHRYSRLEEASG